MTLIFCPSSPSSTAPPQASQRALTSPELSRFGQISPSRPLAITSERPLSLLLPLQYRRRASGWRSNRPCKHEAEPERSSLITRVVAPRDREKSSVWQIYINLTCPSYCQAKNWLPEAKNVDPASVGCCHAAAVQLQVHQFGVFLLLLLLPPVTSR